MGLTKSAFGTPYSLGGDDFAVEERKNASLKLYKIYLKDKEKVEVVKSMGIGMEPEKIMLMLSQIIINHTSDTYEWATYTTARITAKGYEAVYQACVDIDNLRFLQACLLLRALIWHMQSPDNQIVVAPLNDFENQELWKRF